MTESKMSRRAWFRLRPPTPAAPPAAEPPVAPVAKPIRDPTVGQQTIGLAPIEQPPNHDGMDLSKLPPMREAVLSPEQVSELFSDIEELGTDVLLMQRRSSAARDRATASLTNTANQLEIARTSLLSGKIPRVQIRYRWQDSLWIDTLEAKPDGFRIIRIAHAGMQ